MAKKRKPAFVKILEGMNCCYGGLDERECGNCPYDKYNDANYFGESGAECMLRLNEDAQKWAGSISGFTTCRYCCCYHKMLDENGEWRFDGDEANDGYCSVWNTMMFDEDYCSRGGLKE